MSEIHPARADRIITEQAMWADREAALRSQTRANAMRRLREWPSCPCGNPKPEVVSESQEGFSFVCPCGNSLQVSQKGALTIIPREANREPEREVVMSPNGSWSVTFAEPDVTTVGTGKFWVTIPIYGSAPEVK